MHRSKNKPEETTIEEHAKTLDPMAAWFYRQKMQIDKDKRQPTFVQKEQPVWQGKANL
jgi:hypothetical protein